MDDDKMEELLTKPGTFKCKVSSTLQPSSLYASKHMFDDNHDTCWNSDQGTPQYIAIDFGKIVEVSGIKVTFQGGFVGQDCVLEAGDSLSSLERLCELHYILDNNEEQSFSLPERRPGQVLKILFHSSSDFYGRITIYKLELYGRNV